jgi:membrane-associated phospholipid phosphatase
VTEDSSLALLRGADDDARAAVRSPVRTVLLLCYFGALIWWFGRTGGSLDKDVIAIVVCGALALWCIGRPLSEVRRLLIDWLPFLAALLLYDMARAAAHVIDRPVLVTPQIRIDEMLTGGRLPTAWLQHQFFDEDTVHWWDVAATLIYVSHFFASFVVAGWLWPRDRAAWRTFAARFFLLSFAGAVTFALVPTAPPWAAASQFGRISPITRIADHGWVVLHLREPEVLLQRGRAIVNPYAAIPSLHAAYALLIAITLWHYVPRWVRVLLAVYPVAMGVTLVYTGEHYVIDVLIGWAYVGLAIMLERLSREPRRQLAARVRAAWGYPDAGVRSALRTAEAEEPAAVEARAR